MFDFHSQHFDLKQAWGVELFGHKAILQEVSQILNIDTTAFNSVLYDTSHAHYGR